MLGQSPITGTGARTLFLQQMSIDIYFEQKRLAVFQIKFGQRSSVLLEWETQRNPTRAFITRRTLGASVFMRAGGP